MDRRNRGLGLRIAAFAGDLAHAVAGTRLAKQDAGRIARCARLARGGQPFVYPGEGGVRRSLARWFDVRPARSGRPFLPRNPRRGHGVVLSSRLPSPAQPSSSGVVPSRAPLRPPSPSPGSLLSLPPALSRPACGPDGRRMMRPASERIGPAFPRRQA